MSSLDYVGFLFVLPWGVLMLWIVNKGVRSKDDLISLFTVWPIARLKELLIWIGVSSIVVGILCLFLFIGNNLSLLAQTHRNTPGTFIEYHGDHGNFSYHFLVGGVQYHGYSSTDHDDFEQIRAGAPFKVYYYPANPNINNASEPVRTWMQTRITVTFFGLLLMGILAIIIRKLGALIRASSPTSSDNVIS